jgi:hypothetical protein
VIKSLNKIIRKVVIQGVTLSVPSTIYRRRQVFAAFHHPIRHAEKSGPHVARNCEELLPFFIVSNVVNLIVSV